MEKYFQKFPDLNMAEVKIENKITNADEAEQIYIINHRPQRRRCSNCKKKKTTEIFQILR